MERQADAAAAKAKKLSDAEEAECKTQFNRETGDNYTSCAQKKEVIIRMTDKWKPTKAEIAKWEAEQLKQKIDFAKESQVIVDNRIPLARNSRDYIAEKGKEAANAAVIAKAAAKEATNAAAKANVAKETVIAKVTAILEATSKETEVLMKEVKEAANEAKEEAKKAAKKAEQAEPARKTAEAAKTAAACKAKNTQSLLVAPNNQLLDGLQVSTIQWLSTRDGGDPCKTQQK